MRIRYHLDESVRTAIAVGLRSHGVDVTTTKDADLIGATDGEQLAFAASQQRVIVTHDDDFLVMASRSVDHRGICYCHQQKYSIGELMRALLVVDECCSMDEMKGHVEFL